MKPTTLLAFPGPHRPHIKIGDLGSCVNLAPLDVDDKERIKRCITTHEYAAPEMMMVGIHRGGNNKPVAVGLTADVYPGGF